MNTLSDDSTVGAEAATLTKTELFKRFLDTHKVVRGRATSTQEYILEFCEAVISDQLGNLNDALCAPDDPEIELREIAEQIMGCARDLKDVLADFMAFTAKHEREGVRVTTRVCIPAASGEPICGEYEERDGILRVYCKGRWESTQMGNVFAERLAATILREMVATAA